MVRMNDALFYGWGCLSQKPYPSYLAGAGERKERRRPRRLPNPHRKEKNRPKPYIQKIQKQTISSNETTNQIYMPIHNAKPEREFGCRAPAAFKLTPLTNLRQLQAIRARLHDTEMPRICGTRVESRVDIIHEARERTEGGNV